LETALDIIRLMDHFELDKVHLEDSSLGMRIGTTIISRNPERFKTTILTGEHPGGNGPKGIWKKWSNRRIIS